MSGYYLGDCIDRECPHFQRVMEQDGEYAVCDRQGTLCEPFVCSMLDKEREYAGY